jgi:tetratricopeptide (TPR) repeat protein
MKRIAFLALVLAAFAVQAQKPVKPNLNKIAGFLKDGKWVEAKDMIEAATTNEKTKDDGKTWYYRGVLYMVVDTTSDANVNTMSSDAFNTALNSFEKADSIGKGKSEYFLSGADLTTMVTKTQQVEIWANHHLTKGISKYQDENDAPGSLVHLEKTAKIFETQLDKYANDTLTYYLITVIANEAGQPEKAIAASEKYFAKGGKTKDVYLILYQIYSADSLMKSDEKALAVIKEGKTKLPNEPVFPKLELEMLINMDKSAEAKAGLEEAVKKEPNDKMLHFFLGYTNLKLNDYLAARKNFEEAVKLDPNYFQAQYYLANTYLLDVENVTADLNKMGNKPSDSKKRSELVQKRVKLSEVAIPYFEKAEKMKIDNKDEEIEVLQRLGQLYYYTAEDAKLARVNKKLKALGAAD